MPQNGKVPATIITGFLGAGKTSLVRHLLTRAGERRLAVIVNEFGEVGIDGEILRSCGVASCGEDDIVELANGCLCCTVADEFVPTIETLLDRPDPPDHIVIETSGLALPKPLVKAFNWPDIRTRVTVDGVVAVIDGAAVDAGRFAADPAAVAAQRAADESLDHDSPLEELFEDQLNCADLVILNKADLLDAAALDRVGAALRADLRREVKLVSTSHGAVDAAVLLGLDAAAEHDLAARPSHHDGADDHDHDDFVSLAVGFGEIAAPAALIERLHGLIAEHEILRVKGFAAVAGRPMRLVVQGVGGRLTSYFDRDWRADETRHGHLVVIGLAGLDTAAVRAALAG
ncbi:MAG: cobalamin biosynthesis protein CobW [Alphaproteobacteria bacterium]